MKRQIDSLTIRFVAVGGIGFVANYVTLSALTDVNHLKKVPAEIIAAAIALHVTFLLHDRWTYKAGHRELSSKSLRSRYLFYLTSNSFSSVITVVLFALFSHVIREKIIALGLSATAAMVWNYAINTFIIWRRTKPSVDTMLE